MRSPAASRRMPAIASAASATTGRSVWLVPSKRVDARIRQQLRQQRPQIRRFSGQRSQPPRTRLTLEIERFRQQPI